MVKCSSLRRRAQLLTVARRRPELSADHHLTTVDVRFPGGERGANTGLRSPVAAWRQLPVPSGLSPSFVQGLVQPPVGVGPDDPPVFAFLGQVERRQALLGFRLAVRLCVEQDIHRARRARYRGNPLPGRTI